MPEPQIKQFAFIVGEDVFMTITFPTSHAGAEQWTAGFLSNPIVVQIPEELHNQVDSEWTWNGTSFVPPAF
jgi:hypothetical protein